MANLNQPEEDTQWGSNFRESRGVLPLRNSGSNEQPSPAISHRKTTARSSNSKRSNMVESRQRYTRKPKPDPEAFHATEDESFANKPLHYFAQASGQSSLEADYKTPSKPSLKEGRQKLLQMLQNKIEPIASKRRVQASAEFSADGSTASTSGSNSSSSSSAETAVQSKGSKSGVASVSMNSDRELELHARQIRIELRQAEMLELAEEAERAAESGQKSFTGRASTFGGDETEIEIALDGLKSKITPAGQRKVRRALDFGTPLVRRLSLEPAKISVKALRDVAEVVPSFKDFHLHLRTHMLRRKVDKRTLVFEEEGAQKKTSPCHFQGSLSNLGDNEQHVIHLWNSLNFASWTSSKPSVIDSLTHTETCQMVDGLVNPSNSSTEANLGELLADHKLTPLRGSRTKRRPQVEVPPGLNLLNQETFELQADGYPTVPRMAKVEGRSVTETTSDAHGAVLYPSTPKPPSADIGEEELVPRTSPAHRFVTEIQSADQDYAHLQDGSPNSPIVVDDIGIDFTPDQRSGRLYRGPSPPPGLPLTPRASFQRVFDSSFMTPKDDRIQQLLATRIMNPVDVNIGPDFVTPVRLRDIRDDHLFGQSTLSFAGSLPEAPLVRNKERSSSILETPNSIRLEPNVGLQSGLASLGHSLSSSKKRLTMRPSFDKIGRKATDALLDLGARASNARLDETLDPTRELSGLAEKPTRNNFLQRELLSQSEIELKTNEPGEDEVIALEDLYEENNDPYVSDGPLRPSNSMPSLSKPSPGGKEDEGIAIQRGMSYDSKPMIADEGALALRGAQTHIKPSSMDCPNYAMSAKDESQANVSNVIVEFNDIADLEMKQGSVAGGSKRADQSKATADFRCECLISPASSLDSDEDGLGVSRRDKNSSWYLMDHAPIGHSDSNHQSLQAAVAMMSTRFSQNGPNGQRKDVVCASSKENDDFMSNYLYCSKTPEKPPPPDPICSGSAPCQDTKMPCGEVAVDSCVGNFLETALTFLPRKSSPSNQLLSLSRDKRSELQSRPSSWYDRANEKFDRLLERLMGNEHRNDDHCRLSYQAPILKEGSRKTLPPSPPRTPVLHKEVYDEDLGAVVYVPSASTLETNTSHASQASFQPDGMIEHRKLKREGDDTSTRRRRLSQLRSSLSDTADLSYEKPSSIHNRYSM